jgi:hypothetical protein
MYLRQQGLPFEILSDPGELSPDRHSAVIVGEKVDGAWQESLRSYIVSGGSVLDGAGSIGLAEAVETVVPEKAGFESVWMLDQERGSATGHAHVQTIRANRIGSGTAVRLPFDADRVYTDVQHRRRRFYSPGGRFPDERVARFSKNECRKLLTAVLQWLHHQRGLPFVFLWPFPGDARSVFLYRLDSDNGVRDQIDALYALARSYDVPISWFLHVQAHEGWLERFASMEGQEMAVHGYEHKTFATTEENLRNIAKACELLDRHGIAYRGFASPTGLWHVELARAMDTRGFQYSSEFCLDYDNLPFHPTVDGRSSRVLQIPIHPVCIGNLIRAKLSPEEMKRYYRFILARKLSHEEPVVFYHHPTHQRWEIVEDTFVAVREHNLPMLTFGAWADWWERRQQASFSCTVSGTKIHVASSSPDAYFRIVRPDGKQMLVRASERSLEGSAWSDPVPVLPAPQDIDKVRRFTWRLWQHTIEDFKTRMMQ